MMRLRAFLALILLAFPAFAQEAPPAEAPARIRDEDVLAYLDQVIDWQRGVTGPALVPDNARESLLKEALAESAKRVMEGGFAFARAEAASLRNRPAIGPRDAEGETASQDRRTRILKRAEETDRQIKALQAELAARKPGLNARQAATRREQIQGKLRLANAQKDLLQTLLTIFGTESTEGEDVLSKVNSLSRTLLIESERSAAKAAPVKAEATPVEPTAKEGEGIFGISGALFANTRNKQDMDALIDQTRELREANTSLVNSLRAALQAALAEGNRLGALQLDGSAKSMAEHRQAMNVLLGNYKMLADAVVPLGQIGFQLESTTRNLKEWRELIGQDWDKLFQRLLFRLGLLGICIMIPLLVSDVARRATGRYVQDARRQRQLRIFRRTVLGIVLALVVILNFVTEFTSLATFAGFLTAGLAVALQTVLVSLTAHFFFFGRFGVRVGDRVTVSGVTGDVVQLGMLRLYLMELKGEEGDMRPTGKIVAFPNSVLFNAAAFFKQVSGANYGWKELTFLLDSESDYALAKKKVREAVDAVYGEYKEAIEMQSSVLEQSTRLSVKVPSPRDELRVTSGGLAYVVNYPIVPKRAHEIQERITDKLIESFRAEEKLRLILSNPLRIEAVKE